jgi:hypothetical protein
VFALAQAEVAETAKRDGASCGAAKPAEAKTNRRLIELRHRASAFPVAKD